MRHLTLDEDWTRSFQSNLTSAFHVMKAVLARHRAACGIVLVSTSAAAIGLPNHEAIAASKAGLEYRRAG